MAKELNKLIINGEEYELVATVEDGSVTGDKLADGAVGPSNIAPNAVCEDHIDGVVWDLINGALQEIPENSVGQDNIINGAVTGEKIPDGEVKAAHIAPNAVCEDHLDSELAEKINGALQEIPDGAVTDKALAYGSVAWEHCDGSLQSIIEAPQMYTIPELRAEVESGLQTILTALNTALAEEVTA